jgi:hypothetical protein
MLSQKTLSASPRSAGGADVTTGGGSSHALVAKLARSPRAAYRWQLVRALVRFQVGGVGGVSADEG